MDQKDMERLFGLHRPAGRDGDRDGILATFVGREGPVRQARCGQGRGAGRVRRIFTAFPNLTPEDEGRALGEDAVVVRGRLQGTSEGPWFGSRQAAGSFTVPFVNVAPFRDGRMAGERLYSTWPPCANRPICR